MQNNLTLSIAYDILMITSLHCITLFISAGQQYKLSRRWTMSMRRAAFAAADDAHPRDSRILCRGCFFAPFSVKQGRAICQKISGGN